MGNNEGYPTIEPENLDDSLRQQMVDEYVALQASDTAPAAYTAGKAEQLQAHGVEIPEVPLEIDDPTASVGPVLPEVDLGDEIPPIADFSIE